jgi:hypothetical protein
MRKQALMKADQCIRHLITWYGEIGYDVPDDVTDAMEAITYCLELED